MRRQGSYPCMIHSNRDSQCVYGFDAVKVTVALLLELVLEFMLLQSFFMQRAKYTCVHHVSMYRTWSSPSGAMQVDFPLDEVFH